MSFQTCRTSISSLQKQMLINVEWGHTKIKEVNMIHSLHSKSYANFVWITEPNLALLHCFAESVQIQHIAVILFLILKSFIYLFYCFTFVTDTFSIIKYENISLKHSIFKYNYDQINIKFGSVHQTNHQMTWNIVQDSYELLF